MDGAMASSNMGGGARLSTTPRPLQRLVGKKGEFQAARSGEGHRAEAQSPCSKPHLTICLFQRKASRLLKGEDRNKVGSRSIGLDTGVSQPAGGRAPLEEGPLTPSRECWTKEERPAPSDGFSGFSSSDSVLRELDEGQFDQEEGVTQVTCM